MALYNTVIVFDQATKLAYVITWVHLDRHASLEEAYQHGQKQLQKTSRKIENEHSPNLTNGKVTTSITSQTRGMLTATPVSAILHRLTVLAFCSTLTAISAEHNVFDAMHLL